MNRGLNLWRGGVFKEDEIAGNFSTDQFFSLPHFKGTSFGRAGSKDSEGKGFEALS